MCHDSTERTCHALHCGPCARVHKRERPGKREEQRVNTGFLSPAGEWISECEMLLLYEIFRALQEGWREEEKERESAVNK